MKIEGLQFKDALRILADKAGVTLSNFKKEETSNMVDILEAATIFFEKNLAQNIEAKNYVASRGITIETSQKFRIGFAPNDWRLLYNGLKSAGYNDEEIVSSGLCIKHEKSGQFTYYDRFRSRVMFPIMNASGKVVAFTGRIIGHDEGKDGVAKYVNSPETQMYHKSSILFGYNFAKHEIAKLKKVIVVEGQMDVVMCHQAGNVNTVAISGTAFTPEHIAIIKRFADGVVLALDSDKAGYTAMLKSAALALANDLEVEGVLLSEKDPADMIKNSPASWTDVLARAEPIVNIVAKIVMAKETIKPKQMQMLRRDLFPLLRMVRSPLVKDSFTEEVAKTLGVSKEIIKAETESINTQIEIPQKKVKTVVNINLVQILAQSLGAIRSLFSENEKEKFLSILKKYLVYADANSGISIEGIPDIEIEKEIFHVDRLKEGSDFNLIKYVQDNLYFTIQKILEIKINSLKEKIKAGKSVEENLKMIQDLTRENMNLKKEIYA
jgi:DNA primase